MNSDLLRFGAFTLAVIVIAGLFKLAPSGSRVRLRRSVILLAIYAVALFAAEPIRWTGAEAIAKGFRIAAELLEILMGINLAALVVFDLLLRLTRWEYPDIMHDLVVGAAYAVAVGWLMHRVGVNVTSIVATSAVVTAVIGLSLQATLGNVVGGIALQVDESIDEGDWIELDNKVQGQVKKIRWRHTVIETRDWDTLIVPNGLLMGQTIKLLGRRAGHPLQHRMWVYFNVDHRYSPTDVIRAVDEALQAAPIEGAADEPKPHTICYDLARDGRDSFCYYAVRYWLRDLARDDPTSSAVRERIYAALKRAQIPLAVPAQALFVSKHDTEHAERKRAREVEAKRVALDSVELFARLADDEKWALAESARVAPFSAHEVITRQGAKAHWLYVLSKGRAEVRVRADSGEERQVAIIEAPSIFGEMALMTGQAREATVIALTQVECLRIDKVDFKQILSKRPELAQDLSLVLAQRRVELEAARENLDAAQRSSRMYNERSRILGAIRDFFALDRDT